MNLFKQKTVVLAPIVALLVALLFCLTSIPSINPTPKNLPLAIVNLDQGAMGKAILDNISQAAQTDANSEPAVKWITVASEAAAKDGMNDRDYYGALVIPADFSQKQASFATPHPASAQVQIFVNQGMNPMASTMAGQIMNQLVDGLNAKTQAQLLQNFQKAGATLTAEQASALVAPIKKDVQNVHPIGTHTASGNAPVLLFQPTWMASILGAVLTFLGMKKVVFANRKEQIVARIAQLVLGLVISLVVGYGTAWASDAWFGLSVPSVADLGLYLSIAYLSFYLMISALLSWLGLAGMPILVLTLFFSAPLLSMAPEMMTSFYQNWIYSWLPMRFMVEGLRQLFFFGNGFAWAGSISVLLWIGAGSLVVLLLSVLKPRPAPQLEKA